MPQSKDKELKISAAVDIDSLISLRHKLHQLAELSGNEKETAEHIVGFLRDTGPDEIITGVGGEGIIARYKGDGEGLRIMIRCELDALPIKEDNNIPYRSNREGVSHKCGHDGHMAIVVGVASWLKNERPARGEVALLFQPAEETGAGAEKVLQDKKFRDVKPDHIFALHNLPGYEKGQIILKNGTFAAASVGLKIRLRGSTSHAAHPEKGKNPAMAVALLIQLLSAIPQHYLSIDTAAKVTIINVNLGEEAFGTSPGNAEIMATLRSYRNESMQELKNAALNIAEKTADMFELEIETEWVESFKATVNDGRCVDVIRKSANEVKLPVVEKPVPFGWSEDFGVFTTEIPGALFGLGAGVEQPQLHASDYNFPDELIELGIEMFAAVIRQFTNSG